MLSCVLGEACKFHRAVIHGAEAQTPYVAQIVLVHLPGVVGTLTRQHIVCASYVARGEFRQYWFFDNGLIQESGDTLGVRVPIHVVQDPAQALRDEFALQRPGGVDVAEDEGQVGDILVHHPSIDERPGQIYRNIIDEELYPTHELHSQTCGGYNNICHQFIARTELDAFLGEGLNMIRGDRDVACPDRCEEIPIRCQTQSLIPGIVRRS